VVSGVTVLNFSAESGDINAIRQYAAMHEGLTVYKGAVAQRLFNRLYAMEEARVAPTGGPPIIFINFAATPNRFNKQEYFDQLQKKLVENGFNPKVQVKQYSMSDRISAWWNNSPTATISISNYHTGDPIDAGAFSLHNNPNSIIIFNGLDPLSIRAEVATWAYVNATLHEIGHAFFLDSLMMQREIRLVIQLLWIMTIHILKEWDLILAKKSGWLITAFGEMDCGVNRNIQKRI